MTPGADEEELPPFELDALSELSERLQKAQELLKIPPLESPAHPESKGPNLPAVFAIAHQAIARLTSWLSGQRSEKDGTLQIELNHTGAGATIYVNRDHVPDAQAIREFIEELRENDERFANCAELLGLLVGLSVQWAAAGFAPPAMLLSLSKSAPRILELGKTLAESAVHAVVEDSSPATEPESVVIEMTVD